MKHSPESSAQPIANSRRETDTWTEYLPPEQRLMLVAEILATIATRVLHENKEL
jgi:hypothetical protein